MFCYNIETIRDENGDVVERKIVSITDESPSYPLRQGEFGTAKSQTLLERPLIGVDANGFLTIEEDTSTTVEDLRDTMNLNILNKSKEISGGSTTESTQAYFSAYQIRVNNPAEYVSDGLTVGYAITGYTLGDALDTEAKITDYYNKVLVEMDKFRESEIAAYLAAKAAL